MRPLPIICTLAAFTWSLVVLSIWVDPFMLYIAGCLATLTAIGLLGELRADREQHD